MKIPKFRACYKKNKRVFDVLVIDWLNRVVTLEEENIELDFEEVELMQSTGFLDDSEKEIFEGDALVDYDGHIVGYVEMDEDSWRVSGNFLSDVVVNGCLVVGNKFIHPDLLEGED